MQPLKQHMLYVRRWLQRKLWQRLVSEAFGVWLLVGLVFGFVLFSIGYGLVWGGHVARVIAMGQAHINETLKESGFVVDTVMIQGRKNLPRHVLREALGPIPSLGVSLFLDIEDVQARIEQLGWIERAIVSRRLPGRLLVTLHERIPFARWAEEGSVFLLDREGYVITDTGVVKFTALPLLKGIGAPRGAGNLFNNLSSLPALSSRIRVAVRVGNRRWNLRLDNGSEIYLPEENPIEVLAYLMTIDSSHKILERCPEVIDLRLSDRVTIRMGDDTRPLYPDMVSDIQEESERELIVTGGRRT
ncbi:MAG: cell division protein FtsQ/DivIB [Parvularculales bacterium]